MRSRNWLAASAAAMSLTLLASWQARTAAQSASGVVISEFRFRGPNGVNDEFVELFNAGSSAIDVGGWLVRVSNNNQPPVLATRATIPAGTTINPGCYYLVANNTAPAYSGSVTPDLTYPTGIADNGGVAIVNTLNAIVDQVGMGTVAAAYGEGTRLAPFSDNVDRGIERLPGSGLGHVDTNNNAADFAAVTPATPHNSNPASCLHPTAVSITPSASSASVEQGQPVTVFGAVVPGTVPPSTGLQVTANFSALGGASNAALLDNGVAPDLVANDKVFSGTVTVASGSPLGPQPVSLTVTDAQLRTATSSVSVTVTAPPVIYAPHDVQGSGPVSPMAPATTVIVRGVVTARTANGFFMQTEPGAEDSDAATSEGLFVRSAGAPPAAAVVGHVVHVTGKVGEFVPADDLNSASVTELNTVASVTDLGAGTVPVAVLLGDADLSPSGDLDQLERFEGMRVTAPSLTAVSGTGGARDDVHNTSVSDGAFFAVLTGQARPFREPGVERGYAVLPCSLPPCHVPEFDGNPERLRVDTDAIEGTSAVNVSTGAVLDNVTGPLGFSSRTYTIFAESQLVAPALEPIHPAPAAAFEQFTVASLSLDRFYDAGDAVSSDVVLTPAAYQARLAKASLTVRDTLNFPDIIGVQGVEHAGVLLDLAQRIDDDASAAGHQKPQYQAWLLDNDDPARLNVGFLLKLTGSRVQLQSIEQAGAAATFVDPLTTLETPVFDRPPLVVQATVFAPSTLPQPLTVIVNDLLGWAAVTEPGTDGQRARSKRQAQAEWLAEYVQGRQVNDPNEQIVLLGGYQAPAFSDGYVDTLGTLRGQPSLEDQVTLASADVVSPDLVVVDALVDPQQQYSAVVNGNAVALDHVLVTSNLLPQLAGFAFARVNADFPDVLRGSDSTPSRLSDRDPAVAYFTFPPDTVGPVFDSVHGNLVLEATGPLGAVVTYSSPTASDNLDVSVEVNCAPASGATFALGSTAVNCTAQDHAGNPGSTSFTVTVLDTTAPVLTVPASVTDQAQSSSGKSIAFSASATDAVTTTPVVSCAPASGSVFPVGATTVACTAADAAGNTSNKSFVVTVTAPPPPAPANVPGHLAGAGSVDNGVPARFAFDVRESPTRGERGWLVVQVRDGKGRPDRYFAVSVQDVTFSDAPGYAPARRPVTTTDTVTFGGVGNWNGRGGYRFEVTASDRGAPGQGRDTFSLKIVAPNGATVETVGGTLRDGNIQALR